MFNGLQWNCFNLVYKCNIALIIFFFVDVLFSFIPIFDLMLILLKKEFNGNKNNFGTVVLIYNF